MKTVSNDFKQALVQPRTIDAKIVIGNDVLTSDDINNITRQFNSGLFKTIAKMVEIDSNVPIAKDTIINPQFGLYINGAFEYVTLDTYKVKDDPVLNKDTKSYQIKAYDKIIESMVSYALTSDDITFPCTVKQMITAIYTKLGWDVSGIPNDFPNSTSSIEEDVYSNVNMTYRDVLDELCTLCCRWIIDIGGIPTITDTNLLSESEQVEGTSIDITDGEIEPLEELTLKGQTSQASTPTPSSPIPINVVTGRQEINVCGKNRFNIQTIVKGRLDSGVVGYASNTTDLTLNSDSVSFTTNANYRGVVSDYIAITPENNTYIVFSWNNTISSTFSMQCAYYDKNKNFIQQTSGYNLTNGFRWNNNVNNSKYIRVAINLNSSGTLEIEKPQLEISSSNVQSTYEAYTGYKQEINLGKNLFDKDNFTFVDKKRLDDNGNVVNDGDSSYSTTLYKVVPNGTYTIQGTQGASGKTVRIYWYDKNKTFISRSPSYDHDTFSFTTPNNCYYIALQLRNADNMTLDILQIEKGSQATTYSPYFTPIELCKSSDGTHQDFIRKGTGKNLFDKDNANLLKSGYITINVDYWRDEPNAKSIVIPCDPDTTYTISKISSQRFQVCYTNEEIVAGTIGYARANYTTGTSATITTGANAKYLSIYIYLSTADTLTLQEILDSIQIEKGSQATTFEPYGYKDKWYIGKQIGKVVLDGTNIAFTTKSSSTDNTIYLTDNTYEINNYVNGYSNYFKVYNNNTIYSSDIMGIYIENKRIRCGFGANSNLTTVELANQWLSTHNTSVYYPLATPTYTEITNSELVGQLENLMNTPLLRGINHITVSTSNEQPTLAITYINEIETINEEYMKDTNVEIQNQVFFNSLVFSRAEESDNIYRKDDTSITNNGLHEFKVSNMQTLSLNWRDNFIDEMWNYIKKFNYYAFDINTNGIIYLEPLDRFKLSIFGDEYKTSLINSDLAIDNGVNEKIYSKEPDESETGYRYADTTDKKVNRTTLIVDKQQGQIEALTSQVGDDTEKISQLIITSDNIQSNVSTINENLTNQLNVLQSSTSLQISAINQTLENGVEKLTNSLVTIDANGINTSRSDETFNTQITNKTFEVKDGSKELAFMGYDSTLNKTVSRIEELEARKITAGVHRTETIYEDSEYWTADYYVGGGN